MGRLAPLIRGWPRWVCRALALPVGVAVASSAMAADVCRCGAGDQLTWSGVATTSGAAFQCSGDDGVLDATDHVQIGEGCAVEVTGDVLQDPASSGGIHVEAGGRLEASVGDGDRLRLSLGAAGLSCAGDCVLSGAFRRLDGPDNLAAPEPWPVVALEPCAGDCAASPELYCASFPPPAGSPALDRLRTASDLGRGTEDWLCLWDFVAEDHRVSYDDNSCYPVARVDTGPLPRVCVDLRQGADNEYPHRLRQVFQGTLVEAVPAGGGCGAVLDADLGWLSGDCGGSFLRISALGAGGAEAVAADDEQVGRFVRFADTDGTPEAAAYKILQSVDCAGAPAAPHVCAGSSDDVLVIGTRRGVPGGVPAGRTLWIDPGWRTSDTFFVMAPVQVDSATPEDDDSGVDLTGGIDLFGVHFTDLGGGAVGPDSSGVVRVAGARVDRWQHVLIRNDSADFAPNTGKDLLLDGLVDATLGHTVLAANTGHAVLLDSTLGPNSGLVLEDFSIRHHQDGCFNHRDVPVQPDVTVRRAWCAFIQSDAASAQWFAWQAADPASTRILDSACDACDGDVPGRTLSATSGFYDGWTLGRALLWAPMGTLPGGEDNEMRDVTFVGFRGADTAAAPILGEVLERSVARGFAVRTPRRLFQGELDVRDVLVRDVATRTDAGLVMAEDDARVENSAFLDLDTTHPSCLAGSTACRVAQEAQKTTDGVRWRNNLIAWSPGRTTFFGRAQTFRAVDAADPPEYRGLAIAFHQFAPGGGTALHGLTATNVGVPDWSDGPCFEGNEQDVAPAALLGLPLEALLGVLGFVDPATGRFDLQPGGPAALLGCGPDPERPPGVRGYHYVHARTGLWPELLGADVDGDGWPETQAPPCDAAPDASCSDNCPARFNPDQADSDGDGTGDACEDGAPGCGLGAELGPLVVLLEAVRRRRR